MIILTPTFQSNLHFSIFHLYDCPHSLIQRHHYNKQHISLLLIVSILLPLHVELNRKPPSDQQTQKQLFPLVFDSFLSFWLQQLCNKNCISHTLSHINSNCFSSVFIFFFTIGFKFNRNILLYSNSLLDLCSSTFSFQTFSLGWYFTYWILSLIYHYQATVK